MPRPVNGRTACSTCRVEKSATKENFDAIKKAVDSLASQCRECSRERNRQWKAAHSGKHLEYLRGCQNSEAGQDYLVEYRQHGSRYPKHLGGQIVKVFEMLTTDVERAKFATELLLLNGADFDFDQVMRYFRADDWISAYADEGEPSRVLLMEAMLAA